jgi:hypothetical protein
MRYDVAEISGYYHHDDEADGPDQTRKKDGAPKRCIQNNLPAANFSAGYGF